MDCACPQGRKKELANQNEREGEKKKCPMNVYIFA